jgi:hypothetical protein
MFGPAGRYAGEVSARGDGTPDEALSYTEAAKFEPQELVEFLEFCADKRRGERESRKSMAGSKRMQ